ncbi:hypothetical protein J4209_01180 [Candidatus Woesearchaeota archaeon]|nr:hypothetical protein [Candidatus Woesearchaeota archaeon]
MNKKFFYLAAFLVLINLVAIVLAEENMSNASDDGLVEENISSEVPLNLTDETVSEEIALVCDETQCDDGCVVCGDNKCHEEEFVCTEALNIEKILPGTITTGVAQINVLIRNTGNVDLRNISIEFSGDGISTLEKLPIEMLVGGDKDYTFTKIGAAKAGVIDLVIKLYVNKDLKDTLVRQLTVLEEEVINITNTTVEINITAITERLDKLKEKYIRLEQDYQNKKLQDYYVDMAYDNLKETDEYINEAQFYLVEGDYKKIELILTIIEDNFGNIENELENAKKEEKTIRDQIKTNVIYIGSIAAAIVSTLTALGLIRSHINKQKLMELHKKIQPKKGGLKEEKEEIKPDENKNA